MNVCLGRPIRSTIRFVVERIQVCVCGRMLRKYISAPEPRSVPLRPAPAAQHTTPPRAASPHLARLRPVPFSAMDVRVFWFTILKPTEMIW